MQFGHFDDVKKEYVITSPKTPLPWINYLGSENFFSLISNTCGGYSFYKDAKLLRLTRYRYNDTPLDQNGRYYYIKDGDTVWNPGWQPTQTPLDSYECHHGLGYSRFVSSKNLVAAELTAFVPLADSCEVNRLMLTNNGTEEKTLALTSFVEFCFWNAVDDMTNFQRNFSIGEVEIQGSEIYHKTEYRERRRHYAVYAVNCPIDGYDTDRDAFLGAYRGNDRPETVLRGTAGNTVASGWGVIGSHHIDVTLKPGESRSFIFVLGYCENAADDKWEAPGVINKKPAKEMLSHYQTDEQVDAALAELASYWDGLLAKYALTCADEKLGRMVNIWNQYQCMVTFNLSRSASYFESGIGRGMGFRDSNQDILGFVHQIPDRARQRIIDIASTQLPDGGCYHQYQPLTKKGNSDIGGDFSDDPLWMILSVSAYIKETGDWSILDEMVPYDNDESKAKPMLDHLKVSFYHIVNNLGPHGLPLAMRADWNDCINLSCYSDTPGESFQTYTNPKFAAEGGYSKVAESVMVATLFTYTGPNYVAILKHLGKDDEAAAAQAEIDKMKKNVMESAFDGDWFLRAYDSTGAKMGSKECEEGKIFIEPQGFAVMSEIGKDEGADIKTLDSIDKYLNTKYGLVLNNPAYSKYYIQYGEISTYPGGYKENAGIFTHNNAWIICAEAYAGRGDKAFEYYSKIAPAFNEEISDLHKTEPYVYGQMIAGKDASRFGEGKNSWLTGTAAWNMVAISQYILGVQADFDGLKIDPSIPHEWDGMTATRQYRGATYNITVKNPDHVCKGIKSVTVDGKAVEGNVLPVAENGATVNVEVVMG